MLAVLKKARQPVYFTFALVCAELKPILSKQFSGEVFGISAIHT
ncbi:MAG: hypothetical protein ACJAWP_000420 [Porticoccus sp.]